MFDFDASKFILIGIVALIVIGPKDLPRVLRELGRAVAKMRRMASEFQGQFMEAVREADMADVRADVAKLAESAKLDVSFDPLADIRNELKGAVDKASPSATAAATAAPAAIEAGALADASPAGSPPPTPGLAHGDAAPANGPAAGETGKPAAAAPEKGIDAEMQALADALKAEIGAPKAAAGHAPAAARRE